MNSTLTLYLQSKILSERLFKVDSIETYLAGLTNIQINNFQYIKHSLNLTIKVDRSQLGLEMTSLNNINYCKIQNGAGRTIYYFVTDKKWLSENTIQFFLMMDTLNSFIDVADGLTISNKTKILRQHLDRFEVLDVYGEAYEQESLSPYLVNFYDESLKLVGFFLNNDFPITSGQCYIYNPYYNNQDWYLFWLDMVQKQAKYLRISIAVSQLTQVRIAFVDSNNHITWIDNDIYNLTAGGQHFIEISYDNYGHCTIKFKDLTEGITNDEKIAIICESGKIDDIICDVINTSDEEIELSSSDVAKYKNMAVSYGEFAITGLNIKNKIDQYTEGYTPQLYGKHLQYLTDETNMSFFLVYKNQNDPTDSLVNPVDCFLCGEKEMVICNGAGAYEVLEWSFGFIDNLTTLVEEGYGSRRRLVIHGYVQPNFSFNYYDRDNVERNVVLDENKILYIFSDGTNLSWVMTEKTSDGGETTIDSDIVIAGSGLRVYNFVNMKYAYIDSLDPRWDYSTFMGLLSLPNVIHSELSYNNYVDIIFQISKVDRTSAKIIKVIKLPYSPIEFVPNDNIDNCWLMNTNQWELTYDEVCKNTAKLKDFNVVFERDINFTLINQAHNPFEALKDKIIGVNTITGNVLKSMEYETKLYHSDYYLPKAIYDSFSFPFRLELVTYQYEFSNYFKVKYNCTTTINSRFMFTYTDYICDGKDLEDYNNVMPIARNNELPIFNQQYINYIRAGYNYDVKNKTRQEAVAFGGATLSLIGAIASFAGSTASGGATVAMGVGLAVSAVGQYTSAISTTIQLEQSFALKQEQLKQQATSVYGSDDVDLMTAYSHNRLKLKLYEVSPRMKKALFDLFYYTGYISNVVGLPNTSSRTRFNFVSADIVIEQTPNLPKEIVDDIISKYKLGITFIHYYKNTYDFEQQYENWETSLVNKF